MGFTTACIIKHKYDKRFLNKLVNIGYIISDIGGAELDCLYILNLTKKNRICFGWHTPFLEHVCDLGYIDCGTNEELFLAIAALRDDTDKYQWFVNEKMEFVFCNQSELKHVIDNSYDWCDYSVSEFHKATVAELINYFTK